MKVWTIEIRTWRGNSFEVVTETEGVKTEEGRGEAVSLECEVWPI